MFSKKWLLPSLLVFLTLFTRFIKLDWGNGHFFHPDENNMARSVAQLKLNDLNPNFFAYGQFPLYLTFFSQKLIGSLSFSSAVFILRFYSALFSCLSILFFYLLSKKLFTKNHSPLIFTLLLIFNPGLIQQAHFGTTEGFLVLVFSLNLYLACLIVSKLKTSYLFFAALITGLALASKVSALILAGPIYLAFLLNFKKSKNLKKFLSSCLLFTFCFLLFTILFSPYSLLKHQDFLSTINYEASVALGKTKVFYTSQFLNTSPYLFQFKNIFPYVSGLPVFLLSLAGLFLIKKNRFYFIVLIPSLVYFLYSGQLYTKWTRFMAPIFFISPLLAALALSRLKKPLFFPIFIIALLPGLFFLKTYYSLDIRSSASNWLIQNLPQQAILLSEAGNVVNIPLKPSSLNLINFDFYNLDSDPKLQQSLPQHLFDADYILIPSRRIFKNQNNRNFPTSQSYYQALFSDRLGFSLQKTFSPSKDFLLNAESAEETWTVFDRPTIRLYQKTLPLTLSDYEQILL